ncbi:hypothetical protein KFE25_003066 [Diacronema lutheri]|uniref:Sm domain-containing protein n=1 Tax=Diacronema lutheri TaxID=2081491 RepID=A0A8J5X1Q4_DIALT|nr:hypothetical protein KFE25_003066 [Diacronema lutheri]
MADALELVRSSLDGTICVGLSDGRILTGTFLCLDKQKNVLMRDTKETRLETDQAERHIGLVLVPFQHVKSCHALRMRN